jgi:hypothetical protein
MANPQQTLNGREMTVAIEPDRATADFTCPKCHTCLDGVLCPKCGESLEFKTAWYEALARQELEQERAAHRTELERVRSSTAEHTRNTVTEQLSVRLQAAVDDAAEQRAASKQLRAQVLEQSVELRKLLAQRETEQLAVERSLRESREAIRNEERANADERHRLRVLELERRLKQAQEANELTQRKLEQRSPQNEGEVLELDLEGRLRGQFPHDDFEAIRRGERGADIRHEVRTPLGQTAGIILWEAKRVRTWQPKRWTEKAKIDMREAGADCAVVISTALSDPVVHLSGMVWAAQPKAAAVLGRVLRQALLHVASVKDLSDSREEHLEALFKYLTSPGFRHRVEAIQESYDGLLNELERDRRLSALKWAKQERYIRTVLDNLAALAGEFQSMNLPTPRALGAGEPSDPSADEPPT